MNTAILDDLKTDRDILRQELSDYMSQNHFDCQIYEYDSGEQFLKDFEPESRKRTVFCSLVSGYLHGRHDRHGGRQRDLPFRQKLPADILKQYRRIFQTQLQCACRLLSPETF